MFGSKLIGGVLLRDRVADTALAGLGISAALVSVGFAGYMIVIGPDGRSGRRTSPAGTEPAPTHALRTADAMAGREAIDFTPTGSIPVTQDPLASRQAEPTPSAPLPDFFVRDVFAGTALVEAGGTLHMVHPGDTLQGAGQVLAIERRGRGWLVRTAAGIIQQRR